MTTSRHRIRPLALALLVAACGTDDPAPTAEAALASFGTGTVTGQATFTQDGTSVSINLMLSSCAAGQPYPVHIHQGTSCADATAQGGHWDMTRGEGIPDIPCATTSGVVTHTRVATPVENAWSIGGDAATDIVGHVIVVHDSTGARVACGAIGQ